MVWTDSRRVSRAMRYLGYHHCLFHSTHAAITLYGPGFQPAGSNFKTNYMVPLPRWNKFLRFGLFRVRSPLLTESLRFLFLGLLRCFTSPRVAVEPYEFRLHYPLNGWVSPFGILRVKACLQLAVAYRSLPRPSSPVDTKAFTACPY